MAKSIEITLKDRTIQNLVKPGRYTFGRGHNGIYLIASELAGGGLSKVWNQKIYIKGAWKGGKAKPRELGLGEYPGVSVADAIRKVESNAALAKKGVDPRAPSNSPTFKTIALTLVDENRETSEGNTKPRWVASTEVRMMRALNNHCFPFIGDTQVDQIGKRELLFMVAIHSKTPSTTALLIPFMKEVFGRCVRDDYIEVNPINDSFMSYLPRNTRDTEHLAALLPKNLPAAMAEIDNKPNDVAIRALLKTIMLNGVRPHSAEDAEWVEIQWKEIQKEDDWVDEGWEPVNWDSVDGSTKTIIWRIPEDHMKKGKHFNVPVSRQFLEILKSMRGYQGPRYARPEANLRVAARRHVCQKGSLQRFLHSLPFESDTPGKKLTLHGFRSTARTWAEKRKVPDNVAEAALSHNTGSKLVVTYMRWDLLEPRARLQQAYADYATGNLTTGWIWIEPEVQAQIDAERQRADEADRRADEAERQLTLVKNELVEIKKEFRDMNKMLKALLEQKSAA